MEAMLSLSLLPQVLWKPWMTHHTADFQTLFYGWG